MTRPEYPAIAELMGGMFHQDFDLVGSTVARSATSSNELAKVCVGTFAAEPKS